MRLARADGHGTVRRVRDLLILAVHLLITFAKLCGRGGVGCRRREQIGRWNTLAPRLHAAFNKKAPRFPPTRRPPPHRPPRTRDPARRYRRRSRWRR